MNVSWKKVVFRPIEMCIEDVATESKLLYVIVNGRFPEKSQCAIVIKTTRFYQSRVQSSKTKRECLTLESASSYDAFDLSTHFILCACS